jgi:mono/diheme cytochrome c family protein
VSWDDGASTLIIGNQVYAEECRRCHGPLGMGGTEYARERDLDVPSLVVPDWPLAEPDSLRRRIYVGHESGMPIYGDGDLSLREIDATAEYILRRLRPDVLEDDD